MMATGTFHAVPAVQTLVNTTSSPDGVYVYDVQSNAVNSFSQIHIHRYGKVAELDIVMTVKGQMLVGTLYRMFTCKLKPLYTVRAWCVGAQGAADYAIEMGVVSINYQYGYVSFTPFVEVASGGTRTFRFNITYLTND